MNPVLIDRIRNLIKKGKLKDALDLFDESVSDVHIISLKSRLEILLNKKIKGEITFEQETTETNKIVNSLLDWTKRDESTPNQNPGNKAVRVNKAMIILIKTTLKNSLGFYYVFSSALLLLGLILIIFFYLDDGLSPVEGLGSMLVSCTSGLPVREIINRRDRILFLEVILLKGDSISNVIEIEKINSLSWSIIESAVLNSKLNG